jgi:hypothetical protein
MQRKHKPTWIAEIITYTSITYNYNKGYLTSIRLSLINIIITQQEWLTKNKWHKHHKPHTKPLRQWTTRGPPIMTIAASFSHNIPSTLLQDHQLWLEYLQPKERHLYSCGSLPHPYRWKNEFTVSVQNTETLVILNWLRFRKEQTFSF